MAKTDASSATTRAVERSHSADARTSDNTRFVISDLIDSGYLVIRKTRDERDAREALNALFTPSRSARAFRVA